MKCQNCSTENKDNEVFCVICGAKLEAEKADKLEVEADIPAPSANTAVNEPPLSEKPSFSLRKNKSQTMDNKIRGNLFSGDKRKKIIIMCVSALFVFLIGFPYDMFFDNGPEPIIIDPEAYENTYSYLTVSHMANDVMSSSEGYIEWSDGSHYSGDVLDGLPHGYGEMIYAPDSTYYKGEFVNGVREGKGTMSNPIGFVYTGDFSNNVPDGVGILEYANGDRYEGEMADNMCNGNGTYYYANGDVYTGEFYNGKFQGYGRIDYTDGSYYEGEWFGNFRWGEGHRVYSDGGYYIGEFAYSLRNGNGTYYKPNGLIVYGTCENDLFEGLATLEFTEDLVLNLPEVGKIQFYAGESAQAIYENNKPVSIIE